MLPPTFITPEQIAAEIRIERRRRRDEFARAALPSLLMRVDPVDFPSTKAAADDVARMAYLCADAMLAESEKR